MGTKYGDLSDKEQERFALDLLSPRDPLYNIVGKRGLDEILGPNYDPYNKTIQEIRRDILRMGESSKKKKSSGKKVVKSAKGGQVRAMKNGGAVMKGRGPKFKGQS